MRNPYPVYCLDNRNFLWLFHPLLLLCAPGNELVYYCPAACLLVAVESYFSVYVCGVRDRIALFSLVMRINSDSVLTVNLIL